MTRHNPRIIGGGTPRGLWSLLGAVVFAAGWVLACRQPVGSMPTASTPSIKSIAGGKAAAQLNPIDASAPRSLVAVLALPTSMERLFAFAQYVQATPVEDIGILIEKLERLPNSAEKQQFEELAYGKWTSVDPLPALAQAIIAAKRAGTLEPLPWVFEVWARHDAATALESARRLESADQRTKMVGTVLAAWVQEQPLAALAALKSLSKGQRDYTAFYENWARIDAKTAYNRLDQIDDPLLRIQVQAAVLLVMSDTDPAGAVDLLQKLPAGQQPPQLYKQIFAIWAKQDPTKAWVAVAELPNGMAKTAAQESVLDTWSQIDPKTSLKVAGTLPAGPVRNQVIQAGLLNLAAQDTTAATSYRSSMPPSNSRNELIIAVAGKLAEVDPANVLAWLDKNALGLVHDKAISTVLNAVGEYDPAWAVTYINQMPKNSQANSLLQTALDNWAQQDPASALAWINGNLSGNLHDLELTNVVFQSMNVDPDVAAAYLTQLPAQTIANSTNAAKLVGNMTALWAEQNLPAALNWAESLPDGLKGSNFQNQALRGVFATWAATDPQGAANALLDKYGDTFSFQTLGWDMAKNWAQSDPQAALAWVEQFPDGIAKANALYDVVPALGEVDPMAAWDYMQSIPLNAHTDDIEGLIIKDWGDVDMASALQFAADLPDPAFAQRVTSSLYVTLISTDPQTVSQYINSMPQGSARDDLVYRLVTSQSPDDPAAAFAWAQTINDDHQRSDAVIIAAEQWAAVDHDAAIAALQTAPVSDATKQQIYSLIEKQQGAPPSPLIAPSLPESPQVRTARPLGSGAGQLYLTP